MAIWRNPWESAGLPDEEAAVPVVFAGRTARTADLPELERAESMASSGEDRDDIWRSAGWGQLADSNWKFEISDHTAKLRPDARAMGRTLGGVLDHPELFRAYPHLRHVQLKFRDDLPAGHASYQAPHQGRPGFIEISRQGSDEELLKTLLHETMHAVQQKERFAPGAGPKWLDQLIRKYGPLGPTGSTRWEQAYPLVAGEREAFDVEDRMDLTPEQRMGRPPWRSTEVPYDQQLILRWDNYEPRRSSDLPIPLPKPPVFFD
jgi:hypothetical protein